MLGTYHLAEQAERVRMANHTVDAMCEEQRHAFRRIAHHDSASIVHIGGSVAAGTGCSQRGVSEGRGCSYGSRFAKMLHSTLHYANHAMGGTTTGSAIPQLPFIVSPPTDDGTDTVASLLLIDFGVNDWQTFQDWTGEESEILVHGRGGAGLMSPAAAAERAYQDVGAATEVMLRYMLERHPKSAIWLVPLSCCVPPSCSEGDVERYAAAARAHREAAAAMGIAYTAYEDQLRSPCNERTYDVTGPHPTWPTHELWAEAMLASWQAMQTRLADTRENTRASGCSPANLPRRFNQSSQFAVCETPRAVYDALALWSTRVHPNGDASAVEAPAASVPGVHVTSGGWSLYADRPEKPGFITTLAQGGSSSVVEFDVAFGSSPRLTIVFERSYEGFGTATVQLLRRIGPSVGHTTASHGRAGRSTPPHLATVSSTEQLQLLPGAVVLDGLHADRRRVTQSEAAVLNVKLPVARRFPGGFGVTPNATDLVVRLTAKPQRKSQNASKFKVRYVGAC